jgi:hypothetical protein
VPVSAARQGEAVTAPLTHATVNGLAALRGRERETDREWTRACDGESRYGSPSDWIAPLIPSLRNEIPTCPACAVLRDAALEGRTP